MGLVRFILSVYDGLYVFYWRQSSVGFLLLVFVNTLIFLIMVIPHVLQLNWPRNLCSDRIQKLLPRLAFRDLRAHLSYWTLKGWCNPIISTLVGLSLIVGWNLLFQQYGEQVFIRPSASKYSILVTRFSGVKTQERFGALGVRDLIDRELRLCADPITASAIEIYYSNSTCANVTEANKLRKDRDVDLLIWGFVEAGADSMTISVGFRQGQSLTVFPAHQPSVAGMISLTDDMTFTLPASHTVRSTKLYNWLRGTSLYGLTVAAVGNSQWESAATYIERMKSEIPNLNEEETFWYAAIRAFCFYNLKRWDELIATTMELDSLYATNDAVPQAYRSGLVWYTAKALAESGDSARAMLYFKKAIGIDSSHDGSYIGLCRLLQHFGRHEEVDLTLAIGMRFCPGSVPLLKLAAVNHFSARNWAESLNHLEELRVLQPSDDLTLLMLCYASLALDNCDNCLKHLAMWQEAKEEFSEKIVCVSILANLKGLNLSYADSLLSSNLNTWPCLELLAVDFALAYLSSGDSAKANHALNKFNSRSEPDKELCAIRLGINVAQRSEKHALLMHEMQDRAIDTIK